MTLGGQPRGFLAMEPRDAVVAVIESVGEMSRRSRRFARSDRGAVFQHHDDFPVPASS
jgi:hypothetical protein